MKGIGIQIKAIKPCSSSLAEYVHSARVHRHHVWLCFLHRQAWVSLSLLHLLNMDSPCTFMRNIWKRKKKGIYTRIWGLKEGVICQNQDFKQIRQRRTLKRESAAHLPLLYVRLHLVKAEASSQQEFCWFEALGYQTKQHKHRLQNEYSMLCGTQLWVIAIEICLYRPTVEALDFFFCLSVLSVNIYLTLWEPCWYIYDGW